MHDGSRHGKHAQLVLKMADRQNIDLPELVMRADVSIEDFEAAVENCIGCTHPEDCACLLDGDTQSLSLPEYCRNGSMFDRLRGQ